MSGGAGDRFHERRTADALNRRAAELSMRLGRQVTLMEVCGTHTHAIGAAGLRAMLPAGVRLVSGPGCPVCVTPVDVLDRALALAALPDVTICTFGDLLRVPGSDGSLETVRAGGADVRIVYSPLDAVRVARENPARRVVLLSVGFETTAPLMAAALAAAEDAGVPNLLLLPANKLVPPALAALLDSGDIALDGLILPGHVSVVIGADAYAFLAAERKVPAAIVGFTPADVLLGVTDILDQLATGAVRVANLYARVVRPEGNAAARALIERFFEPADTAWRGLGVIPRSGLALRDTWAHRDASRIDVPLPVPVEPRGCRCGDVLKGVIDPPACALFGRRCTPESPVGACMVSSEGTCAAWFRHERWSKEASA